MKRASMAPVALGVAAMIVLAGCRGEGPWQAPAGFVAAGRTLEVPPDIETLSADSPLVAPVSTETRYYSRRGATGVTVTATLAVFDRAAGAQAAYNGWYARFGFLPAVERYPIDAGQQAEGLELGWPPLHAAIARGGRRFVVVEGDESLPDDVRRAAMESLIQGLLPP